MSKTIFDKQIMPITDKMYRYACSILKNKALAQDVVQECLLKIWKNRMKLSEINNVESWAMRITRNQCYDWVKINRFSLETNRATARDDGPKREPVETDETAVMEDRKQWLQQIINALPKKQKEIYHLREVEELSYQDIAETLSLNLSEVKVTLHRTRQKIRSTIEKIDAYGLAN
ncbi:MAG: RNA polymerase sigma factor [Bacteroidales bacterium]|nr:RNA polymerase sigma factor [Bacteroidales bacterium]